MKNWIAGLSILLAMSSQVFADGYIKARGKPTGAGLFVDGKYVGPAGRFSVPEKYALPAGDHDISLKDPRYEDFNAKVTIRVA